MWPKCALKLPNCSSTLLAVLCQNEGKSTEDAFSGNAMDTQREETANSIKRKEAGSCIRCVTAAKGSGYLMFTTCHLLWCQSCLVQPGQSIDFHRTSILCFHTRAGCTFTRRGWLLLRAERLGPSQACLPDCRRCHLPQALSSGQGQGGGRERRYVKQMSSVKPRVFPSHPLPFPTPAKSSKNACFHSQKVCRITGGGKKKKRPFFLSQAKPGLILLLPSAVNEVVCPGLLTI